ncbi:MAG: hypothetical protein ABFD49_02115 [Armatimonadota bacterium]|nr:hypothetical protein [bacterium]
MFTLKSNLKVLKGGEKMKTLGLVLAIVVLASCSAFAEVGAYDVYSGFNLVAAPVVPLNSDPLSVFDQVGLDYYSSSLSRFDGATATMVGYDPYNTSAFGGVLLGDGYWLWCDTAYSVSFDGVADGVPDANNVKTDMWISLPGDQTDGVDAGGWNLIGNPFNHDVPFGSDEYSGVGDYLKVTDGVDMKTIEEAEAAGWISGQFSYYDGNTQTMYNAGYFYCDDYYLRAGKGYWVYTNRDNLALIIPADVQ